MARLITITQQDGHDFTATEESTSNPPSGSKTTVTVTDTNNNTLVIPVNFNVTCLP